ncbi:TolC family protein [Flavobacterium sp.]|uniref:TolC family protein n=1 Tax=Flavobacterium sp. TaxID=239 RepID=UPI00262E0B97|nr:TolC family protein [Flavobacterium sp.]MDD3003462.1 TolC family protein [Flavobacterium sp.]
MQAQKNKWMLFFMILALLCNKHNATCQELQSNILTYTEYLGIVKKFHPRIKQSNLLITAGEAELLKARGAFDPKIEVDYEKKQFKDSEYYSILNSSFKIPTWYGIEIKAGFDNSEGIYVNPQNGTPNAGLTSLGVTIPIGQGLWIDQRMTDLRKAKLQIQLSKTEQRLVAAEVLYDASVAYFDWLKAYNEIKLYENYLQFAETRYNGVLKLIDLGDKPAIDSVEAGIMIKNRKINLQEAELKLTKAKLELANFLWIENVPVELQETLIPDENLQKNIVNQLPFERIEASGNLSNDHPKIQSLQRKIEILTLDQQLKSNLLLPKIDVGYYYLSEPSYFDNYRWEDYKIGINFTFPIFLRKERGALNLAKLKLQDSKFELDLERLQLENKIKAGVTEIKALQNQMETTGSLIKDYRKMLDSEDRLFTLGESSMFLLNSRENSLITSQLSQINLENRFFNSYAHLFKILGDF